MRDDCFGCPLSRGDAAADAEEALLNEFLEWMGELIALFEGKWGCKLGTAEFATRAAAARAGDYDTDDWLILDEQMKSYRGPDWADEYPPEGPQVGDRVLTYRSSFDKDDRSVSAVVEELPPTSSGTTLYLLRYTDGVWRPSSTVYRARDEFDLVDDIPF